MLTWIAFSVTSVGAYFVYIWISDQIKDVNVYKTAVMLFSSPLFYFTTSLSVLSMFALDLLLFALKTSKDTLLNYLKI